jgi:Protein of unknown function (DUF3078)
MLRIRRPSPFHLAGNARHSEPRQRARLALVAIAGFAAVFAAAGAHDAGAQADAPVDTTIIPPGPWDFGATIGANLAQSAFSSNWAGGDQGSFVWVGHVDLSAERQFNTTFNWANTLQLAYGQTANQVADPDNPNENTWESPDKTTDLIQLESTARFTLQRHFDPYAALRVESQFLDKTDPRGALHFNPFRLKESAGIARVFEKTEERELISRVGLALRQNIGRSFVGGFDPITMEPIAGLDIDTETSVGNDGGFEWQTDMKWPILEDRVLYKGQLLVYVPVFYSQADELEDFDRFALATDPTRDEIADFWQYPDVNFQNGFTTQITKVLSVDLFLQWIYNRFDEATQVPSPEEMPQLVLVDRGVRKAGQFKQVLSIALSYTMF